MPENERHVFPSQLNAATDVVVEGEQLGDRITGKKAYWKSTLESTIEEEELGLPSEVSVEELSLQHYRAQGWQGCVCFNRRAGREAGADSIEPALGCTPKTRS